MHPETGQSLVSLHSRVICSKVSWPGVYLLACGLQGRDIVMHTELGQSLVSRHSKVM
jgi:hypothetical protein